MVKTFFEFIQEKWVVDFKKRSNLFSIYENPSSSDLVALKKSGLSRKFSPFYGN